MKKILICLYGLFFANFAFGAGELTDYVNKDGEESLYCDIREAEGYTYDCTPGFSAGQWRVKWDDNTTVSGTSQCSDKNGSFAESGNPGSVTNGQNCWCKMDSYSLTGGASVASAGAWVFSHDNGSASHCANACANNCAYYVQYSSSFRAAVFGSLGAKSKKVDTEGNNSSSSISGTSGNSVQYTEAYNKLNAYFATIVGGKKDVWKDKDGNFNTKRLASDLTAGVVLGTVGGVVSGVVIKKKQIEKGFEALHCTVGGQTVANWGDTFTVGLTK